MLRLATYDLAVIGSGGGAFAAAIAARRQDRSVVMIEAGTLGGTCVNVGCIPSKALLAAAEARQRAGAQRFPGVSTEAGAVDFAALIAGKREIVEGMRRRKYIDLAREYGIEQVAGRAHFVEGPALDVGGRRIEATHYLVATGTEPRIPDIPGLDESGYLTSTTAMELDRLPASLLVLGGGYVAMEMAQLFAHLGCEVTMLVRSKLARREEPEVAEGIREAFTAEGIRVMEGLSPSEVRRDGAGVVATAAGTELRAEGLLVGTGRRPRTAAGLTEAQALEQGIDCECRVLDLEDVPRAVVSRNTRGVVKLVAERETGRVVGVHLLAEGAGDAILAGVYAIEARRTVAEMADAWDPYLTMGEAIHLAAVAFTRDPGRLSCCAA